MKRLAIGIDDFRKIIKEDGATSLFKSKLTQKSDENRLDF